MIPMADPCSEPQSRTRALVMSVGIANDAALDLSAVLAPDIELTGAEDIILIASEEGYRNALRIVELVGDRPERFTILKLTSAHDMDEAFRAFNDAIERLIARGIAPEEIAINFTSGTKIMDAAGVLAAVFNRCLELRYQTVMEPRPAAGSTIRTRPAAVFAYQDLLRGRAMALELQFAPARALLSRIDDSLLSEADRRTRAHLMLITDAYSAWESFYYRRGLELYHQTSFDSPLLKPFRMTPEGERALADLTREMEVTGPGQSVLMDIYNNGMRRLESGDPDDAFIRLYRAMEVLTQWILRRDFGIDTDDVDTRKIPPRNRVGYEALRSLEDGKVKIGLRRAFELLIHLETPIGLHFQDSGAMRQVVSIRRSSILAHGLAPTSLGEVRKTFLAVRELFVSEIPDFDAGCALLQFPWIRSTVAGLEAAASGNLR